MFRDWYQTKTRGAAKACWFGAVALIPATLIAACITWWVIFVVIWIGPARLFHLSTTAISVSCWVILGLIFVWQFTLGRQHSEEYKFSGKPLTGTEFAAIRLSGEPFLTFIFDPKAGLAFVTFIAAWFITAPKLAALAIVLYGRAQRLNADEAEAFMPALRELLRERKSIPLAELAKRHKISEPLEMLRTLTAIDGVVALTREELALTIAPRLSKEFEDWARENVA